MKCTGVLRSLHRICGLHLMASVLTVEVPHLVDVLLFIDGARAKIIIKKIYSLTASLSASEPRSR